MREQTGLDALATLCGGVANATSSQALKNEIQRHQQHQQHQQHQHQQPSTGTIHHHHHSAILNTQHPAAAAASASNQNSSSILESSSAPNTGASGAGSQSQQQLWYQAFMNAAAYGGLNPLLSQLGGATNVTNAAAALLQQQQQAPTPTSAPNPAAAAIDPSSLSAVQQLAFISAYQAAAAAAQPGPSPSLAAAAQAQASKYENDMSGLQPNSQYVDRNFAAIMIARAQQQQQQQSYPQINNAENIDRGSSPASASKPPSPQMLTSPMTVPSPSHKAMTPPKASPPPFPKPQEVVREKRPPVEKKSHNRSKGSTTTASSKRQKSSSAQDGSINPSNSIDEAISMGPQAPEVDECDEPEGKKLQKRAANRRSAQLSRKRKKQFIEELKEENDDLRRKEQILSSIPDLVVAFALCGKILFISNSVETFLGFKPDELENSCFWNRLCDESIRLLKAAFMDALVAKKPGVDVTPLGEGLWEVRLVDKEGTPRLVSLNGVVHFSSDNPECVCSIRPIAVPSRSPSSNTSNYAANNRNSKSSKISLSSNEGGSSDKDVKPQQSVLNTISSDVASSVAMVNGRSSQQSNRPSNNGGRGPLQVSDGDSFISESNSDE